MSRSVRDEGYEYDVALSFAGQQRPFVETVAAELRSLGIRVFYDDYEKMSLWGKDLYEHLDYIYQRAARFCVVFISDDYAKKVWTTHERKSAQARAVKEAGEYVLPFRFDQTEVPGLRSTISYLTEADFDAPGLAQVISQKLGPRLRANYMPPEPVALYTALGASEEEEREAINQVAHSFFRSLNRMSDTERLVLGTILTQGCDAEMPENVHMELDLVRRDIGISPAEVVSTLEGMVALGVNVELHSDAHHANDVVVVSWDDHTAYEEGTLAEEYSFSRSNEIAVTMLNASYDHYCPQCAADRIKSLDFSELGDCTLNGVTRI
jgi:hypothetical protein